MSFLRKGCLVSLATVLLVIVTPVLWRGAVKFHYGSTMYTHAETPARPVAIVFGAGFLLYLTGTFGAGDAKFAAAMAGIFVGGDIGEILLIVFVCMVGALLLHRILRSLPFVTNATPDWESWTRRRYFPFGLALSSILVFYLLAAIWPQV